MFVIYFKNNIKFLFMRSTIVEISIANLKHNLSMLRKKAGKTEIMPIVKADAYGHGIVEITKLLRQENARIIGLAFADEAVKLRQEGDTGEIFVLIPGTDYDTELYCAYNLHSSIEDYNVIQKLSDDAIKRNMKAKAHLFINTGMNRDGIEPKKAVSFMDKCRNLEGVEIIGIMTHLASSELEDRTFAIKQLNIFDNTLKKLYNAGFSFKYIHALNSSGVLNFQDEKYNLARCGISLYGYMDYPELANKLDLKPILRLKSKVININNIESGDNVGYSLQYIAESNKRIAVVPLGYGDGYHRILSNKAECLIHGNRYKLVGTICMDQCLIDIGSDNIEVGDEVVFIGEQGKDSITAFQLAEIMGTIPYEITTALKWRIPRIYVDNF
jgi:alanine racemase